jgi:hypothetical protein
MIIIIIVTLTPIISPSILIIAMLEITLDLIIISSLTLKIIRAIIVPLIKI